MGEAPDGEVAELARLGGGRFGQLMPSMAGLDDEQAGQPVEIAAAVLVPDVGALAPHDDRDLFLGVGAESSEVHPQVALGQLLQGNSGHGHRYLPERSELVE